MKRGLVKLDLSETPVPVYERRLDALRDRLKEEGCNVGLIYADVSRGGDLSYLTNFCLYWNEAVLAVPLDGPPVLIMKLSPRVNPWIKRTTILDDIRSGPNAAKNVAAFLDERAASSPVIAGLVDREWWPAALAAQLEAAAPDVELRPLGGLVRKMRRTPDAEELSLLEEAGRILSDAINEAAVEEDDGASLSSMVGGGRRAGYADLEAHCRTAESGERLIDAWGQYRYVWAEAARTTGGAAGELLRRASDAALAALKPGASENAVKAAAQKSASGQSPLQVACWSHVDIETRGAYRGAEEPGRAFGDGEVVALRITLPAPNGVFAAAATVRVLSTGSQIIAS